MNAETQTETKSNDINVNVNINNNKDDKKTSLIKRTEEQLIQCPESNNKNKKNKRFELYWDYTTNKSGKQMFTFTGTEMGEKFWSPEEKNKLNVGDLVVFKKSGHLNNNVKARIYAKTGLIGKIEALEKGIIDELPKIPDQYDIKFISPPLINGKMIEKEKGVDKNNLEKIPGYRFFFCNEVDYVKKSGQKHRHLVYNKQLLKKKVKNEMKKGFIKNLPWDIKTVQAKYTNLKKDPLTGLDLSPDKLIDRPNSVKFAINSVNLIDISEPVRLNRKKPNEVHKIRALVHIILNDMEDGKIIEDNYQAITSILDCKGHKRRVGELIEHFREESKKNAAAFGEYLDDQLTIRYAKNYNNEMQWYQNQAKEEIAEEYLQKRLKKRKDKQESEEKKNKKEEEQPKKREDKLKKAKEVIKKAEEEAKKERRNMEEMFDRDTDAQEKKGGSRKRKKQKRNKTRKKR